MDRVTFTRKTINLMARMFLEDEHPIIDYVLRSKEEQQRLFALKLSKCDGVTNISAHQTGHAVDIYFIEDGKMVDPKKGWEFWHRIWQEELGGKHDISWDEDHFEM